MEGNFFTRILLGQVDHIPLHKLYAHGEYPPLQYVRDRAYGSTEVVEGNEEYFRLPQGGNQPQQDLGNHR